MKNKDVIKKAESLGVKLKVGKTSSGKVLFPKKLEAANKMLDKLRIPIPA
ncbi:MAG: hypothetical protein ABIX01_11725 [Chitinophagaceae bacterium]